MPFSVYKPQPQAGGWVRYNPKPNRKPKAARRPKLVKPVRPTRPKVIDPLAALSDQQVRAKATSLSTQATAPLIAALSKAFDERSRAGQSAIQGTTQNLAGLLAPMAGQTQAAYGQAQQQQSQVNSELANRLGSFGQSLGAEQTAKLALQDAPKNLVGEVAGGTQQTAQGVANANYATGAAETGRLIGEGAAATAYAGKLPGFAAMSGIQSAKQLEMSLAHEFAEKSGELTARGQQMYVDLYDKLTEREFQKALARESGQFNSEKLRQKALNDARNRAYHLAELAYKKAKAKADRNVRQASDAERARHNLAGESQQERNRRERERSARESARDRNLRQGNWQVDGNGKFKLRYNKKTGKYERIPIKKGKSKSNDDGLG